MQPEPPLEDPAGKAPTFRLTEYLLPLLLVLLVAWGGWALIQRSLQRARERDRERAPLRLPLPANPPGSAPSPAAPGRR